ncbi:MAG: hypothetical protein ACRDKX_02915, partial [Solirubrobacterales bacterium]
MRGIAAAALLLVCAALAGCGGDGDGERRDRTAATAAARFGVNAQRVQLLPAVGRVDEMERQLDSIAELGLGFVRTNLDWRALQPLPPDGGGDDFDWRTTDVWVKALAERGLRWQPTVQTPTPEWAVDPAALAQGCANASPPRRPADYGALVGALASRYGAQGSLWSENPELPHEPVTDYELWNEPNFFRFWCPRPDPESFAALALAGARALHAADPEARAVLGGLAGFRETDGSPPHTIAADEFLDGALAAEPKLAGEIDVVAIHPYGRDPGVVARTLAWFRSALEETTLRGRPLSVNEFGWPTKSSGNSIVAEEDLRADFVAVLTPAIAASTCGVEELALHAWTSPEVNASDHRDWFGVADPVSAEPYPTALVYAAQAARLSGRKPPSGSEEALSEAALAAPED